MSVVTEPTNALSQSQDLHVAADPDSQVCPCKDNGQCGPKLLNATRHPSGQVLERLVTTSNQHHHAHIKVTNALHRATVSSKRRKGERERRLTGSVVVE